ncbi:hypothetical protein DL98DRAFT_594860 [Cadophora sp. DSE1049]|nr:hypothetical protein DL98DRAFT_594860 [Cadophora sp. DSE1049]
MSSLYRTAEHVSELSRIASVNHGLDQQLSQQLKSLVITRAQEETQIATSVMFPLVLLPVGKTSLALQFAHSCAGDGIYDAIFWVQCETSVTIRQSFGKIAEALEIPGAERDDRHEESLIAIKSWLKLTSNRWLIIFDNVDSLLVESDKVLRPYWPDGVSGAVLITSRAYFNFIRDTNRQGQTVKPLDPKQSWDLLLDLLGDHWKALEIRREIPELEIAAVKSMIKQLEGLPLTIEEAATLITNDTLGGRTIARTYEAFKDRIRSLPERLSIFRSVSERAPDPLWDITFKGLSRNARTLIGVLTWLSPDAIPIQLFQAKDSSLLPGSPQLLHTNVTISPGLDKAICQLQEKKLIRYNNRVLSIHRVVQEAVNFQSVEDLQESFDAATKLVSDRFPKRLIIGTMYQEWSRCKQYTSHVASLSKRLSEYSKSLALKRSTQFVELLAHFSWYLFELGDYDTCEEIFDTALTACQDKKSLLYSQLRGTQSGLFFDLNLLSKCREAWEETLQIREESLPHDDPHVAGMVSNLGNLDLPEGNVEAALRYYERALQVWINSSEESAQPLAKTYLSLGRAHMYQGNLAEALRYTAAAETLAARAMGTGVGVMANIHYAAWKSYDACLKIGIASMPLHPIVGATWYSLACVEFAQGNEETAKAISRLRSQARDDGPIARILWKRATILESRSAGTNKEEVFALKAKANEIKQRLMASGEGGMIHRGDDDRAEVDEEDSYDALVPLCYR